MENITIREARPDEFETIITFLNDHFVPNEPTCSSMKLLEVPGYRMPYFDEWCRLRMTKKDSINVIAVNSKGEILGASFGYIDYGDDYSLEPAQSHRCSKLPEGFGKVLNFLEWLEVKGVEQDQRRASPMLPEEKTPKLDITIISTPSKKRIPGLGTSIAKKMVEIGDERGVAYQSVLTTSLYSAKIFKKLGFKTVSECNYSDYKIDGKVVFPTADPHKQAGFYARC